MAEETNSGNLEESLVQLIRLDAEIKNLEAATKGLKAEREGLIERSLLMMDINDVTSMKLLGKTVYQREEEKHSLGEGAKARYIEYLEGQGLIASELSVHSGNYNKIVKEFLARGEEVPWENKTYTNRTINIRSA